MGKSKRKTSISNERSLYYIFALTEENILVEINWFKHLKNSRLLLTQN